MVLIVEPVAEDIETAVWRPSRGVVEPALSFAKILSGVNAFEISNLQEQETESRYPGDRDVTM
jgi:hypothetical protein